MKGSSNVRIQSQMTNKNIKKINKMNFKFYYLGKIKWLFKQKGSLGQPYKHKHQNYK